MHLCFVSTDHPLWPPSCPHPRGLGGGRGGRGRHNAGPPFCYIAYWVGAAGRFTPAPICATRPPVKNVSSRFSFGDLYQSDCGSRLGVCLQAPASSGFELLSYLLHLFIYFLSMPHKARTIIILLMSPPPPPSSSTPPPPPSTQTAAKALSAAPCKAVLTSPHNPTWLTQLIMCI